MFRIAAAADLQNFRARDAFRIRQVGTRHQRATQRNRIHHSENAAERADQNEIQKGNSVHQPIMIKPGKTKMIDDSVPAAEATVCTMLFS